MLNRELQFGKGKLAVAIGLSDDSLAVFVKRVEADADAASELVLTFPTAEQASRVANALTNQKDEEPDEEPSTAGL